MARPKETFNKKELEKRRLQKRKEKEQRREERKASGGEAQSWEDMIAYVDENGNITSTPPDPSVKSTIKAEDIVIGSRNVSDGTESDVRTGKVIFFNEAKGFGFIEEQKTHERIFVHSNDIQVTLKENDHVTYDVEKSFKGFKAINVKLIP